MGVPRPLLLFAKDLYILTTQDWIMVGTEDKLIGGGVITVVVLGVAAYLIFKDKIGNVADSVTKIPNAVGDVASSTASNISKVQDSTTSVYSDMMDFVRNRISQTDAIYDKITDVLKITNNDTDTNRNARPNNLNNSSKYKETIIQSPVQKSTNAYATNTLVNNTIAKQLQVAAITSNQSVASKMSIMKPSFLTLAKVA